jgi:hypothetical protein
VLLPGPKTCVPRPWTSCTQVFIDKRPESLLGLLTVNETAADDATPPEDGKGGEGSATALAIEATTINQNFSQQAWA